MGAATAVLLDLPFPLAGPLPVWRTAFAWFALAPLLVALLEMPERYATRKLRWRMQWAFLGGWWCGALWFGLNDYWVYNTMHLYGQMNEAMAALCLVLFSLYLGVWFGVFALGLAVVREGTLKTRFAWLGFAAIPLLWVGMELAIARISEFPWDQLGMSQVDNGLLTRLAPWVGVYGISFVVAAGNGLLAALRLKKKPKPENWNRRALVHPTEYVYIGIVLTNFATSTSFVVIPKPAPHAAAVLIQPNLSVDEDNNWSGPEWDRHVSQYSELASHTCGPFLTGMPDVDASRSLLPKCVTPMAKPDLVVFPESPAPFHELEPRFQQAMQEMAQKGPLIVGDIGMTPDADGQRMHYFNSATVVAQGGKRLGRYDKIHLVPFGEYVPFRALFFFVKQLTDQLSDMGVGSGRMPFAIADAKGTTHRYGIFICYESVFADEVREFAKNGAEVFVNISDDGWYGDSSAPWQHLNMARMRAIENRRWILRDTNTGVTAVIDPYGEVRQSIARHTVDTLAAQYGFNEERTFYTEHGDWFAYACEILSLLLVVWAGRSVLYAPRNSSAELPILS
jgi:apolipoprotein N-acyltransferase